MNNQTSSKKQSGRVSIVILMAIGPLFLFLLLANSSWGNVSAYSGLTAAGTPGPVDCSSVSEIPSIECYALMALYNDTDGSNWTN